jgi:predicted  nucleic acid-binding Zn-ribbon protein
LGVDHGSRGWLLCRGSFPHPRDSISFDAQIASVEADREALIAKVDPALFSRYQRIWDKRRDFAIARIEHDSCGGCHLKLPPQTIHITKGEKDIASCDFCSRLLFWVA